MLVQLPIDCLWLQDAPGIHPGKPADYRHMFEGNVEDTFKIGVRLQLLLIALCLLL